MKKRFIVKHSKIEGLGVFALQNIKKGEVICTFRSKPISISKLKKMYASKKERIDDPFQVGDKKYILLYKPYIYFNHSCSPNMGLRDISTFFALKDIKKGEEITYDYSTTEWTNDAAWKINWTKIWEIKCNCGSKECRGDIRVFSLLPERLKQKYYEAGALPEFIIEKLGKD